MSAILFPGASKNTSASSQGQSQMKTLSRFQLDPEEIPGGKNQGVNSSLFSRIWTTKRLRSVLFWWKTTTFVDRRKMSAILFPGASKNTSASSQGQSQMKTLSRFQLDPEEIPGGKNQGVNSSLFSRIWATKSLYFRDHFEASTRRILINNPSKLVSNQREVKWNQIHGQFIKWKPFIWSVTCAD